MYSGLGLLYLNVSRIVQPTGGHDVTLVDDRRHHIGVVSNTMRVHVRPPPIETDLSAYSSRSNAGIVRSLRLYYFASHHGLEGNLLEAFLQMYLTLETLVPVSDLTAKYSSFTYLRRGIVHASLSDDNTKTSLLAEFGAETPDWRERETESKLLEKYNDLCIEVERLLKALL
ncbi:MAG: hypothetical protein JRN12_03535 [Nitrososphaerota archaeon]|nr:hypothetical protein [Nitrososphaerota archaeon]MDG6950902.1 hypothetical protein [Nitrososphaerota archaeon]